MLTSTKSPSLKSLVATLVPIIQGLPISLETIAEWLSRLPRSTIIADAVGNKVTHPGSVLDVTSMSPFSESSSVGSITTRTFACTLPGQQPIPFQNSLVLSAIPDKIIWQYPENKLEIKGKNINQSVILDQDQFWGIMIK